MSRDAGDAGMGHEIVYKSDIEPLNALLSDNVSILSIEAMGVAGKKKEKKIAVFMSRNRSCW